MRIDQISIVRNDPHFSAIIQSEGKPSRDPLRVLSLKESHMEGILPAFLKFNSADDLIRVGRDYDGGYLVSKADVLESDFLIGLGINDDWSFESDFLNHRKVPVIAYDASVSKAFFAKKALKALLKPTRPKKLWRAMNTYFSYKNFFRNDVQHREQFVGLESAGPHCTMNQVLGEVSSDNVFLKIDVEGSEYRFLDTLIENKNRISGMVIEFHDCDIHLQTIKNFVEKFGLKLVHVHPNNCGLIRKSDQLPLTMELTFSKYAKAASENLLPHPLDMPNDRKRADIQLSFSNTSITS